MRNIIDLIIKYELSIEPEFRNEKVSGWWVCSAKYPDATIGDCYENLVEGCVKTALQAKALQMMEKTV